MMNNIIETKSFAFAVRIVKLYKMLTNDRKECVLSKQLLRSGTSIGANVSEGERGQSKADFYAKMCIALKEANESYYWLRLLHETDYLTDLEFESIEKDVKELIGMLTSICKTQNKK
jgi:four helix bundle protein